MINKVSKSPAIYFNREKCIFLLAVVLLIVIGSIIILSMVPPVTRDELVHHLAVPKLYLKHGGIYEIPYMDFSYFPMNLDLLYMIPLYFGNDIVPKFIHFIFALLTAWLLFGYLKKRTIKVYGLAGAILFLSIPVIIKLSITAYVDLGVIFFTFASLLFVIKWLNEGFKKRYLFFAGIMCGLALGTKYSAIVAFALIALFIPFLFSRYAKEKERLFIRSLSHLMIFLLASIAIFSPWMARNYYWKGNPIYPLYNNVFNPPSQKLVENKEANTEKRPAQNSGLFTYRGLVYGESGLEIAMLPLRIFVQGKDDDPRLFDGKLNPFLLIFTIFAFFPKKNIPAVIRRENMIMFSFSFLYILIAMFTTAMRIRYISPVIPPLTVLSILGLKNMFELSREMLSGFIRFTGIALVTILFILSIAMNALYGAELFSKVKPFSYIMGRIIRDEYISKFVPEYPVLKYINKNVPKDSNILFVYLGRRGYYCDRDYVTDENLLTGTIMIADNPDSILSALKKRGITHILISLPVFDKWVKGNCSPDKQEMLKTFFSEYTIPVYYENGIGLNRLQTKNM
jgi:4-amino-4-deoxy-L-arabinose transferase-like glycosyltransferase